MFFVCLAVENFYKVNDMLYINSFFLFVDLRRVLPRTVVFGFMCVLSVLLLKLLVSSNYSKVTSAHIGVLVGGGFFTLLNRTLYGYVYDYFDFFGLLKFNIADFFVCLGLFYFFIYGFIISDNTKLTKGR